MMHKFDLVMDFQFGSTGKGLIAGWLAKREHYDTAICSFATNAGHTYKDADRGVEMMTQQLPTGIICPTVKNILLGPGSLIHVDTLLKEIDRFGEFLKGKRLVIHPHAAIVTDGHAMQEHMQGQTKMGSTAKGVGAAMAQRIMRGANGMPLNIAAHDDRLKYFTVSVADYNLALANAENLLMEGAQGFSLSLYHGQYPYTTSRDVTPWQILADCGVPFKWASYVRVIGTLRTFPIRVNNRDGSSGPGYSDQKEIRWEQIGVQPELTTVTKLPRRLFTFSQEQLTQALFNCSGYWDTRLFLNFANYLKGDGEVLELIQQIETPRPPLVYNRARVAWVGYGPDDSDVHTREEFTDRPFFHQGM